MSRKRISKRERELLETLRYYQQMNRVDERALRAGRQKVKMVAEQLRAEQRKRLYKLIKAPKKKAQRKAEPAPV